MPCHVFIATPLPEGLKQQQCASTRLRSISHFHFSPNNRAMKRIAKWMTGVVAVLLVAKVYSIFFPWSPLLYWREEIGLDTARMRSTTYLCRVCIYSREEPTLLSEVLQTPRTSVETRWGAVNTFSPGVGISPHHDFHGAFAQISNLEASWGNLRCSPEAKRLTAQALLDLWRSSNEGYQAGFKLLRPLRDYYISHHRAGKISDDEVIRIIQNEVEGM